MWLHLLPFLHGRRRQFQLRRMHDRILIKASLLKASLIKASLLKAPLVKAPLVGAATYSIRRL